MGEYIIKRHIRGTTQYLCGNKDLSFRWAFNKLVAWRTNDKERAKKIACNYRYAIVEEINKQPVNTG